VIKAIADQIIEKDEQLNIKGSVSGYTVTDAQLKIYDATRRDATKTKITFTPPAAGMPENSNQQVAFSLPAGVSTEIPIKISLPATVASTATRGVDYTLPTDTTFMGTAINRWHLVPAGSVVKCEIRYPGRRCGRHSPDTSGK
jgi:hypothetical protein